MKVLSNIARYIVIILLVICLIGTIVVQILQSTILNQQYIIGKLYETNYYNNLYKEVESNFEKYIYQSGLDEDVLKSIITEEEVKQDTIQIISNLYSEKVESIDITKIESRLQENIDKSLDGQDISNTTKDSIKQFIQKITDEYKNTIVHTKYEDNINKGLSKIILYSEKAKIILLVADFILIAILLLLNAKKVVGGLENIGIAIFAVGIFSIIISIIINSNVNIDYITVISNWFSVAMRSILHDIVNTITTNGITFSVIGILIILTFNIVQYKKEK